MLDPGEFISHYKIVSPIGAGGMGEVYLAEDTKLGRQAALKVLLPEVSGDSERVKRFIQEAKAASALNHPNILTVYEIGNFDGSEYIATEFIKGDTLRERMRSGRLNLLDAIDIALQTTAALDAAHQAGIVHRDLKPENIMIRDDRLLKVLDFGLAKLVATQSTSVETTRPQLNTQPGMLIGTVAYMSPEQARGRTIDPRSDIFSFGIVLFELFTGRRPFDGEGHLDLISSILKDEPPPLCQAAPDMPRELERIVEKTLRKDRNHRYQHVRDLHIDLEDLRDELKFESKLNKSIHPTMATSVHATEPSNFRSALTTGLSKTRRFTVLHALLFVAAVTCAAAAAWYFRPVSDVAAGPQSYKTAEIASWSSAPGEVFGTASFSPDGKMIAFASTRSGTKAIWVTQTGSADAIQVTNDEFANTFPIWSPKGDELAYVSRRPAADGTVVPSVWRAPGLGGTPRFVARLADGSAELRRWTESGKIYYQLRGDLHAVDVATGAPSQVTSLESMKPMWVNIAPDEKSIAYAVSGTDGWRVVRSDPAGAKAVEIGRGPGRLEGRPAWSFEADRFFISVNADSATRVMLLKSGSGSPEVLTAPEPNSSVVDAAADGRSAIFGNSKEESNLWRVDMSDGRESPVARDLDAELWPAVAPNSQRVAFQSVKGLGADGRLLAGAIVAKSILPGSDAERTNALAPSGFLPDWSSDGTQVAYLKVLDGSSMLFSVDSNGGAERQLANLGKRVDGYSISPYNLIQTQVFAWSPIEKKLAYAAERDGITNIYTVSAPDGTEAVLTANNDATVVFSCPIWSRDGRFIAFSFQRPATSPGAARTRGIRVIETGSGIVTDVIETPRIIRHIGWADDDEIIVAEADKDNSGLPPQTNLMRISIRGGSETSIASLKNIYFYNIFVTDDGKQIAYAARDQNLDDIWVVPSSGGGTPRRLTRNNDTGQFFSRLDWFRDGTAIVFGKQTRFSLLSLMYDID